MLDPITQSPFAPLGVDLDVVEQDVLAQRTDFQQQHDGGTGAHRAITCDSLTARAGNRQMPIDAVLRFRGGAWLLDEDGNSTHRAGLRPLQWSGDQHNYSPPGLTDAIILEVDTDADRNITGIARAARQKRLLIFGNRGNYTVTLKHNSSSSEYYNRFGLPNSSDLAVGSAEYVWLYYDVGSEIWRAVSML